MKVLVIGAGSMGNRRIRNMKFLGITNIGVFDFDESRLEKFNDQENLITFTDFESGIREFSPDALIICTPPNKHFQYVSRGIDLGIPSFLEASVEESENVANFWLLSQNKEVFVAPSCTMRHFNFVEQIRSAVENQSVGKLLYINYHVGQYLPDWHPWQNINDFYVSVPETSACKEIVPFELTWLCEVLNDYEPKVLTSVISRTGHIDAPIDDLYNSVSISKTGCLLNLTIEILSRPNATRKFQLIGTEGTISYDGLTKILTVDSVDPLKRQEFNLEIEPVEGYIYSDEPYEKELSAFFNAVVSNNSELYPNDLARDSKVLKLLQIIEEKAVKIG